MLEKIAIVTPTKPTYSETFLQNHIERLPFKVYHYHSRDKRGFFPIFDFRGKPLFSNLDAILFLEYGLDILTNRKGLAYSGRINKFCKQLKDEGIGAILAEYGQTGAHILPVAVKSKIPLFVYFHGKDAFHYETVKKYGKEYRKVFKAAAGIICVSRDMKNALHDLGCEESKIRIIPCAPSHSFNLATLPPQNAKFLSIGRFTEKKAPHLTIKAFAKTLKVHPDARLEMASDGPLWASSKSLAEDLGLGERIVFSGRLSPDAIITLYKKGGIFLQHSVVAEDGDSEGTPVSVLEAMLAGLPVISTRHMGIKDIIEEDHTGLLVDEGDWEGMSDKMTDLLDNPSKAAQLARAGKAYVASNHTMEQHIADIAEFMRLAK